MHDAVDRVQPARRALRERRIAGGEPVASLKPNRLITPSTSRKSSGLSRFLLHLPLCASLQRNRCEIPVLRVSVRHHAQTLVEICRCLVKLEGYEVEI